MSLKFLVVEGNTLEARERHKVGYGETPSEAYATVLQEIAPDCLCDIAFPADEGANLPDAAGLEIYDAVVLTGSSMHLWNRQPEVTRQIDLARSVFHSEVPFFGSCWGLQVASVAAGGDVQKNPKGREVGFARNITVTEAGRNHPMLAGRPVAFDAPCVHLDAVVIPPGEAKTLASNAIAPIQAAEIRMNGGTFWGVQYHPEFSFEQLGVILKRNIDMLVEEGFFVNRAAGEAYTSDLAILHADRNRLDLAWRYGLDAQVMQDELRLTEIRNFIEHRVRPEKSRRGRG